MPVSGHTVKNEEFARGYANLLRAELSDSSRPWLDRLYNLARSRRVCTLEESVSDFGAVSDTRSIVFQVCVTAGAVQKLVNFFDPRVKVLSNKKSILLNAIVSTPTPDLASLIDMTASKTYGDFLEQSGKSEEAAQLLQMFYETLTQNVMVSVRFLNNDIPVVKGDTSLGLLWTDGGSSGVVTTIGVHAGTNYRISTSDFDLYTDRSEKAGFATLLYDWEPKVNGLDHQISVMMNRLGKYVHVECIENNRTTPLKATLVTAINVACSRGDDVAQQLKADFEIINPFCEELKEYIQEKRNERDEALKEPGALYNESYPHQLLGALRVFARNIPKLHKLFLYAKNAPRNCLSPSQQIFLDVAQKLAQMSPSCVEDETIVMATLFDIGVTNAVRTADFMVFLVLLGARVAITLPDELLPPPQINKGQLELSFRTSGPTGFCQTASWLMAVLYVASKDRTEFVHACTALGNLPELLYDRLMKSLMAFMVGCPFVLSGVLDGLIQSSDVQNFSIQSFDSVVESLGRVRKCTQDKLPSDEEAYEKMLDAVTKSRPDVAISASGSARDKLANFVEQIRSAGSE